MEFEFSQLRILGLVALAMGLGAIIGIECELADKPAGLRTHIIVAGAASLFVALGDVLVKHFDMGISHDVLRTEPIRVIEAVITGVSFLGAGTIIRAESDRRVEGRTTAASISLAAVVGGLRDDDTDHSGRRCDGPRLAHIMRGWFCGNMDAKLK